MSLELKNDASLRWKCRRGMLELDKLLLNFFDNHFQQLAPPQQENFKELLAQSDQHLWDWLLLNQTPESAEFAELVLLIQKNYTQSNGIFGEAPRE